MTDPSIVTHIDPGDSLHLKIDGRYERFETGIVRRYLRAGQTFVDVGAHIGYYSVLAASIVGPAGRVVAFEPHPGNAALWRSNMERFGDIGRLHQRAASDRTRPAELFVSPDNSGDNRMFRSHGFNPVPIETTTIDECPELAAGFDFIKIDTQGHEMAVLRGASVAIERSPRLVGIVEYWPFGMRVIGSNAGEFLDVLAACKLRAYVRGPKRRFIVASYPFLRKLENHINLIVSKEPLI
jgi:FkbM family methyltransferase